LGDIALHTHDYAQAEGHYRDALAFQQTINNRFGVFIITTSNLVTLACAQDQYDEAGRLIEQARKIGVELGMSARSSSRNPLCDGKVKYRQGDYAGAQQAFAELLVLEQESAGGSEDSPYMVFSIAHVACAAAAQGEHREPESTCIRRWRQMFPA